MNYLTKSTVPSYFSYNSHLSAIHHTALYYTYFLIYIAFVRFVCKIDFAVLSFLNLFIIELAFTITRILHSKIFFCCKVSTSINEKCSYSNYTAGVTPRQAKASYHTMSRGEVGDSGRGRGREHYIPDYNVSHKKN